jgi:hypothetical protein
MLTGENSLLMIISFGLVTAADGRWIWRPIGRLSGSAMGSGSRFLFSSTLRR